jgi:hypothetical protein
VERMPEELLRKCLKMSQDETDPFKSQERGGWIMLKMM